MSSSSDSLAESSVESASGLRRLGRLLLAPVRVPLRFVRHLPDRLLHPSRRRRAIQTLAEGAPFESILVLCLGNVCRSPYAERVIRRALVESAAASAAAESGVSGETSTRVRSAGFIGGWDRCSPAEAVAQAARRDVELREHRSQIMNHSLVDSTDLFLVTDLAQARRLERMFGLDPSFIVHLGDLDPSPIRTRTIEDPWGKGDETFERSFDRIDRCVDHLARILAGGTI